MADVWLPDFLTRQPLGSVVLWSCLAALLPWSDGVTEFLVHFDGRWELQTTRILRLRWNPDENVPGPMGIPERTETELAACALAVLLLAQHLDATVESPAETGERFDYWVELADRFYGLEVSGTRQTDRWEIWERHRDKTVQLQNNPYGIGGFVVVVGFGTREIVFSHHTGR